MTYRKTRRPAHTRPGSMTDAHEAGERLRLSRERLLASELVHDGPAWRLWGACVEATFGYAREADHIYIGTLAELARMKRQKAAPLMRRFNELGVFVWDAAPRGSRAISRLGLPHMVPPGYHEEPHVPPGVPRFVRSGTNHVPPGVPLQSNTSRVLRSRAKPIKPENRGTEEAKRAESVTPTSGEPQTGPVPLGLEGLSLEELRRGVDEYGPTVAGLYRDELERRARLANPLRAEVEARFGGGSFDADNRGDIPGN